MSWRFLITNRRTGWRQFSNWRNLRAIGAANSIGVVNQREPSSLAAIPQNAPLVASFHLRPESPERLAAAVGNAEGAHR